MKKLLKSVILGTAFALCIQMTAFAGDWISDPKGWKYQMDNGDFLWDNWHRENGKDYYVGSDYYLKTDMWIPVKTWFYVGSDGAVLKNTTTPDGYQVDSMGNCLDHNGKIIIVAQGEKEQYWADYYSKQSIGNTDSFVTGNDAALTPGWKKNIHGWWYENEDGTYPISTWKTIDGKEYYFGADSYLYVGRITPDGFYVDESGAKTGRDASVGIVPHEYIGQWRYSQGNSTVYSIEELNISADGTASYSFTSKINNNEPLVIEDTGYISLTEDGFILIGSVRKDVKYVYNTATGTLTSGRNSLKKVK